MPHHIPSRRSFFNSIAASSFVDPLIPYVWTSSLNAADSPSDRIGIGAIGVGSRGTRLGNEISQLGNMVACADVDAEHRDAFAQQNKGCIAYEDYRIVLDRKDVDAVTIGTPVHLAYIALMLPSGIVRSLETAFSCQDASSTSNQSRDCVRFHLASRL